MLLDPEMKLPEVREFLACVKGKRLLHLSDTPTALYPSVEALVREIRPDVLIHTGDCADEYKAGRREEDVPAYREAVPRLFAALTPYVGRTLVVPGNNDLPEVLASLPGVELVPEWTRTELFGVTLELSHFPNPAAFGADFALYGHSASPDLRLGLPPEPGTVYRNGNYEYTLIDTETKRFLPIPWKTAPKCARIFLVRHGQPEAREVVDGNPDLPKGDPPLTGDGIRQSKYVAMELKRRRFAGTIYSSPFLRALETARETAWALGAPIVVEPTIREISKVTTLAPDFVGETLDEMRRRIPEISPDCTISYPWWDHTPETSADVLERVAPFLDRLIEAGGDAVLFAHGAVVNAAVKHLLKRSGAEFASYYAAPPRSNCALSEFRVTGKRVRAVCVNGTDHLPSLLISSNKSYALSDRKKWVLTQMHLHADCEERASIRSHAAQAAALGYDAIYITEHDTRMNYMPGCVRALRLERAGDAVNEKGQGWYTEAGTPCRAEARGDGFVLPLRPGEKAVLDCQKKQQVSLLAEVTLELDAEIPPDGFLTADVRLSQRPDLRDQHLVYTFGADVPASADDRWSLPLEQSEDGLFRLPLSEDVLRLDPEFGQDNAFLSVTLSGIGFVRGLEIHRRHTAEAVRQRMRQVAEKIGKTFGLRIIPCFELTYGSHRNCYSAQTPVIDYEKTGYVRSPETGTAYLQAQGALYACNHPFADYRKEPLSHEEIFAKTLEELTRTRCDGARLLEVGFPNGRYGFSLEEHLKLWDALSLRGVQMIGYGDSDSHNSRAGWKSGNCFGTWICSAGTKPEQLEAALWAGTVCFGDPNRFRGTLTLQLNNCLPGSVIRCGPKTKRSASIRVKDAPGCTLRIILHGEKYAELPIALGELDLSIPVSVGERPYSLLRAEVLDADGEIVCCSNPIFMENAKTQK